MWWVSDDTFNYFITNGLHITSILTRHRKVHTTVAWFTITKNNKFFILEQLDSYDTLTSFESNNNCFFSFWLCIFSFFWHKNARLGILCWIHFIKYKRQSWHWCETLEFQVWHQHKMNVKEVPWQSRTIFPLIVFFFKLIIITLLLCLDLIFFLREFFLS